MKEHEKRNHCVAQTIIGQLSGKKITIPKVNALPMPSLAHPGVVHNGKKAESFGKIASSSKTGNERRSAIIDQSAPLMKITPAQWIHRRANHENQIEIIINTQNFALSFADNLCCCPR